MFRDELEDLRLSGLYRSITDRGSSQGRHISLNGRNVLNFSSNDYLGLASDPALTSMVAEHVRKFGFGAGASRLLSGGTSAYEELEGLIAELKYAPKALIFNSGYAANLGTIPALAGEGDAVYSDELNHASIIDGCRLCKAAVYRYRHADAGDLRSLIRRSDAKKKLVVTDSIFSMDGDIAPLDELSHICREEGAILYIDDAHGTGVLGEGSGALRHFNIAPNELTVQMGTMSKALGSMGGFVAAGNDVIDLLINRARSLVYSTALPSVAVQYSILAINKVMEDRTLPEKLALNVDYVHNELDKIGLNTRGGRTQIVPVIFDSTDEAVRISESLLSNDIYAPVIRPPTVKEPRIRISVTVLHTREDIDMLVDVLRTGSNG
ncbi:MAG: 8-amino-7-oxononanoate synthase [Nitrospirota bacterium]|nr:MAG: 8-amino-7-oxononanoate synthase [Nitrospirota bacterium]